MPDQWQIYGPYVYGTCVVSNNTALADMIKVQAIHGINMASCMTHPLQRTGRFCIAFANEAKRMLSSGASY